MDELNLSEIEKKLNTVFESGERLVFWYDPEGSFVDSVNHLNLKDVKIWHLTEKNAYRTKLLLEHEDPESKYLIYAPFEKPDAAHNHLEDTVLYSKRFYADRLSLIVADIGLPASFRNEIQKLSAFFGIGKKPTKACNVRTNAFIETAKEIDLADKEPEFASILAMCIISKSKNITEDDLFYAVLSSGNIEEQTIIKEFENLGLAEDFWDLCESRYGYNDPKATLLKFVLSLFAVYTAKDLSNPPASWRIFNQSGMKEKASSISVLLENMMNNVRYQECFNNLSDLAANRLNAETFLASQPIEELLKVQSFRIVDQEIIHWIIDRERAEEQNASLNGFDIPSICEMRTKMHFGSEFEREYALLLAGYHLLSASGYKPKTELKNQIVSYIENDYQIDNSYRKLIYALDSIEDTSKFEDLITLLQNIYQNDYLEKTTQAWNSAFEKNNFEKVIPTQNDFYRTYVSGKGKTVVIISDAFRYETGRELANKLTQDPNCDVKLDAIMGPIPSYTDLGMPRLLPHHQMDMTENYEVLADGMSTKGTLAREKILQKREPNSTAMQYEDAVNAKVMDLRAKITGKQVIYIYHNTIDDTGEHHNERDVFTACDRAISDIFSLIKRMSKGCNVQHFVVTADHGFIYSRKNVTETDKLENKASKSAKTDRRFIIDQEKLEADGVFCMSLGKSLNNDDPRWVMLPKGMSVFKTQGGGMNYVHGGSSPQELIVPVINIYTQKGKVDTTDVTLTLVTPIHKITNLKVKLKFFQPRAVSDTVKKADFRIHFESEDGEMISNEVIISADSTYQNPTAREYELTFNFKRKSYDNNEHRYFLKIVNDKTGAEVFSNQVIMDLPFTNDFGF